jgi:hypothetical protein
MRKMLLILTVMLILVIGSAFLLHLINGFTAILALLWLTIAVWQLAAVPVVRIGSSSARLWIIAGFICLAGLIVPTSLLPDHPIGLPQPIGTLAAIIIFILPFLGLILVNLLIQTGINLYIEWKDPITAENMNLPAPYKPTGREVLFVFILAFLLFGKILYNFYWLIVWDSTYDPIDIFWLFFPMLSILIATFLSINPLADKTRLVGPLYLLFAPAILFAVYACAKQVDFRQLTEERAARISQALETYHRKNGVYPANLGQLSPWYMLTIPSPVIINGAGWCYNGGDGYYRLGYVYREHWSAPQITGRLFKSQGEVASLPTLCEKEIAEFKNRNPGFWLGRN